MGIYNIWQQIKQQNRNIRHILPLLGEIIKIYDFRIWTGKINSSLLIISNKSVKHFQRQTRQNFHMTFGFALFDTTVYRNKQKRMRLMLGE